MKIIVILNLNNPGTRDNLGKYRSNMWQINFKLLKFGDSKDQKCLRAVSVKNANRTRTSIRLGFTSRIERTKQASPADVLHTITTLVMVSLLGNPCDIW